MLLLFHGVPWSHIFPAVLALFVSLLYIKSTNTFLKLLWGILWLLLIPNTSYIFTDLTRIILNWNFAGAQREIALILGFILLEAIGLITYLIGMLPFETVIQTRISLKNQVPAIIVFNFIIGFGMVLGRTGYVNSYVIFTQPAKIFSTALSIITSLNLLGLVVLFGILCNLIYFIFRKALLNHAKRFLS